jgi:hypothetical protein
MTQPVQIVLVLPDAASNKRVNRPEPAPPIAHKNGSWPLQQPIPDAETRRYLDDARRAIASRRPEIERFLREGPRL